MIVDIFQQMKIELNESTVLLRNKSGSQNLCALNKGKWYRKENLTLLKR